MRGDNWGRRGHQKLLQPGERMCGELSDVPPPGQGSSQLYFGRDSSSDALQQAVGGWRGWRSTRMTLFQKYVPTEHAVPLGRAAGTRSAGDSACPGSYRSTGNRADEEVSQIRTRHRCLCPFNTLEPKAGFVPPYFFFSFLSSFFPMHNFWGQ